MSGRCSSKLPWGGHGGGASHRGLQERHSLVPIRASGGGVDGGLQEVLRPSAREGLGGVGHGGLQEVLRPSAREGLGGGDRPKAAGGALP